MTAEASVRRGLLTAMDHPRCAREGETALSPERKGELPDIAAKEGARGGTMGFPTLNIVKAVLAAAEAS